MRQEPEAPTLFADLDAPLITLEARGGPLHGHSFSSSGTTLTVGRSRDCTLCIPLPRISRLQARTEFHGGTYWLTPLSGASTTAVNGKKLKSSVPLEEGDCLLLGNQEFVVHYGLRPDVQTSPPRRGRGVLTVAFLALLVGVVTGGTLFLFAPDLRRIWPEASQELAKAAAAAPAGPLRSAARKPLARPLTPPPPPRLELVGTVAHAAPFEGEVRELAAEGTRVATGQPLFVLMRRTHALEQVRKRVEQLKPHETDPEYADFVDEARKSLAAEEERARLTVKAQAPVFVLPGGVKAGEGVNAGDEVLKVATHAELSLPAQRVEGTGRLCRVWLDESTAPVAAVRASYSEPERVRLAMTSLPGEALGSEVFPAARARCSEP